MIPIGFNRNADEDREEYLRNTPGCDDEYRYRINDPHHIDVSEDLIELEQERHLQRSHGDVVDNHDAVSNLFASLDKLQSQKENGLIPLRPRHLRSSTSC